MKIKHLPHQHPFSLLALLVWQRGAYNTSSSYTSFFKQALNGDKVFLNVYY